MTEEEKKQLEKSLQLAEENNKMLHTLVRSLRWGLIFSVVKWVVIIGAALGLYYFLQPLVEQVSSVYESAWSSLGDIPNIFNSDNGQ